MVIAVALLATGAMVVLGQETETLYLSGEDKDTPVEWEFYCTAGRNSGEWTTIGVPSNWELQGFGTYNYGQDTNKANEQGRYRRSFELPDHWKDKIIHIVFEGVMHAKAYYGGGIWYKDAIDIAATNATVSVAASVTPYVEDLTITTNGLELAGANDADPTQTVIQGVAKQSAPPFPDATSSTNVDLQANGVEIHGFTFLSPLADASIQEYSSGIVLKGTDIEIHDNIFDIRQNNNGLFNGDTSVAIQTLSGDVVGHQPVDISGLNIHDNTFQGTPANGYYGVYINPQDQAIDTLNPVTVENNDFTGTIWRAITTERSKE